MEQHAVLITTFIERVLDSNLKKINNDVIMGAKIIWKKYYKQAYIKYESLNNVVQRLNNDLQKDNANNVYINAYIDMFGKFW